MLVMFVVFQADANPVQVLCTPSRRGQQCLTNNVVHIRGMQRYTEWRDDW